MCGRGACSQASQALPHKFELLKSLMNRPDDSADQAAVVPTAKVVCRLYGDIFRSLPLSAEKQPAYSARGSASAPAFICRWSRR